MEVAGTDRGDQRSRPSRSAPRPALRQASQPFVMGFHSAEPVSTARHPAPAACVSRTPRLARRVRGASQRLRRGLRGARHRPDRRQRGGARGLTRLRASSGSRRARGSSSPRRPGRSRRLGSNGRRRLKSVVELVETRDRCRQASMATACVGSLDLDTRGSRPRSSVARAARPPSIDPIPLPRLGSAVVRELHREVVV